MTPFQRALVILLFVALFSTVWMCRYTIVPVAAASAAAYRLDRFTGGVEWLTGSYARPAGLAPVGQ